MKQEIARKLIAAMDKKATEAGVPMAMAVCDADGTLVAFERQENVLPVSIGLSQKKAFTAIQLKMPTANLANLTQPGQELWGLHNDPKLVVFGGGIPLVKDGLVVGAVGVSGGSVAEDVSVAEAGAACWNGEPAPCCQASPPSAQDELKAAVICQVLAALERC